nr:putative GNAT-family acetyltransferase [Cladonia uncialis subsp. uncialis]
MMQVLQLGAIKLSFVFFFRRIFVVNKSSRFAHVTTAMIVVISLWIVAFFFGFLLACKDHTSIWWNAASQNSCFNFLAFENGFALSDSLMDVMIMAMPVPMVWRLHMTTGRKIAVTGIFAFGLLAVIASLERLIVFYQAKHVAFKPGTDTDLLKTLILFWSLIESVMALLAVCLPALHTLFRKSSLESVIRSVRTMASLGSETRRSQVSHTDIENRSESTTSYAQMVPRDAPHARIENIAMRDLSSKASQQIVPQGEIAVNTTFTQIYDVI